MFELSVKTRFSAAHSLSGYDGACSALHGHNWDVEVFIRGRELNQLGILADFKELKGAVKEIIAQVDHIELNTLEEFKTKNPTSENIARFFFRFLSEKLDCEQYKVHKVSIYETPESCATYWEGGE